jgi:hypothetical protein
MEGNKGDTGFVAIRLFVVDRLDQAGFTGGRKGSGEEAA